MVRACGFQAATITDHDFVSREQVERARSAAGGLPFVPGIELSVSQQGQAVHLLGYYVDPEDRGLQAHIEAVQQHDRSCSVALLEAARPRGANFELEELAGVSLHTYYSMRLVKRLARDLFDDDRRRMLDLFLELLGETTLTYAELSPWSVREGIELIHGAGGLAVLAHPGGEAEPFMRRLAFLEHGERMIRHYTDWGLDGIEVSTPVHTGREKHYYRELAGAIGLLATAGSDCHGNDPLLGPASMGSYRDIPDDLFERMEERRRRTPRQ